MEGEKDFEDTILEFILIYSGYFFPCKTKQESAKSR